MHTYTDLIFLWILKIKFLEVGNNFWGNRSNCEFWKPSWQRINVFAMRLLGLGGGLLLIIVKSIKPKWKYLRENMNSFTQQLQALLRTMLYFFSCVIPSFLPSYRMITSRKRTYISQKKFFFYQKFNLSRYIRFNNVRKHLSKIQNHLEKG